MELACVWKRPCTEEPSVRPTQVPTEHPTEHPTQQPTCAPHTSRNNFNAMPDNNLLVLLMEAGVPGATSLEVQAFRSARRICECSECES